VIWLRKVSGSALLRIGSRLLRVRAFRLSKPLRGHRRGRPCRAARWQSARPGFFPGLAVEEYNVFHDGVAPDTQFVGREVRVGVADGQPAAASTRSLVMRISCVPAKDHFLRSKIPERASAGTKRLIFTTRML
jgi:hypothetical protein